MSESNGCATAADIFGQCGVRRYTDCEVLGVTYRLQSIDAGQHERLVRENNKKGGMYSGNLRVIVMSIVDGDNKQVFTEDDIKRLKKLDTQIVITLAKACCTHSRLEQEYDDEEPEKN